MRNRGYGLSVPYVSVVNDTLVASHLGGNTALACPPQEANRGGAYHGQDVGAPADLRLACIFASVTSFT